MTLACPARWPTQTQLYGWLFGQDQATRLTVFVGVSVGVLVILPQQNEKAKLAREKLKRQTNTPAADPAAAAAAAAAAQAAAAGPKKEKLGKKGRRRV